MSAFCDEHDDVYEPCLICEINQLRAHRDEAEGLYAATANHLRRAQAETEQLRRLLRWSLDYIGIDWDTSYPDEPPAVTEARAVLNPVEGAVT